MNEAEFWKVLDMLDWDCEGNDDMVLKPLVSYLSKQSDNVIFEFENIMAKLLYDIDSKKIAEEIYGTSDYFSGDEFLYIRCCAIINGQRYYEDVRSNKRCLSRDLDFEAILYVPSKAWAEKHGKDVDQYPHFAEPSYETCSNEELWK